MSARLKQKSLADKDVPAAASKPQLADLIMAEGVSLHRGNQLDKAEALYRAVLALDASRAEAHYQLGAIYHVQNKLQEAMVSFREAVYAKSDFADAYANLGTVLKAQGMRDNAVIFYRQALALAPLNAQTHANMGVVLNELGRNEEAALAFRKAMVCAPDYEWSYVNYTACLTEDSAHDESLQACRRVLTLNPALSLAHYNLGASYKALNRLDDSIASFRQAVALRQDFGEAHFALGQMLLTRGDFAEGWREYDWRWTLAEYGWLKNIHGDFKQPRWAGESLSGKTILVYAEQGLGDAIQYVRYLPRVVAQAGKVVLAVHPPLKSLFAQIEGVEIVALDQVPLPAFDYHCPLLTLPMIFDTGADNIPADIPYLTADPEKARRWRERIRGAGLRVGVVWAGNPTQKGDRLRSPGLKSMMPVFSVPGVDFVALQMGPGRKDLEANPLPSHVQDLGPEIGDFADTAAIMSGLDLMISSCTAPLHLAGALGVPTWGAIPFAPHLLWQLERTDSPWYPSLRLYRQDTLGTDWSGAIGRMTADLAVLAKKR